MTAILVTTTEHIPGQEYEVIGEVFGLTTQSKNVLRNIGASLKNVVGGEIRDYTKMLDEARNIAVDRLRQNAVNMGADAVVMMRFDSGSIGTDMQSHLRVSPAFLRTQHCVYLSQAGRF